VKEYLNFHCRHWLPVLAEGYAQQLGCASDATAAQAAAEEAVRLLELGPWHFRLLVGGVEIAASLWCVVYRFLHKGCSAADEVKAFAAVPVIAAPLLRLYRSLVAMSWFEQPAAMQACGLSETPEARQAHFRAKRSEAV
jgi:hypothetical protein